jgi:enolase
MIIQTFNARKILNSRKEPTIAVQIKTKDGTFESSAPEGASKGENEALPFSKKGIEVSIQFANALGQRIIREHISFDKFQDLEKIESIFHEIDKTKRLELTGGNTLFAIEAAILKAIAASYKKELWEFLLEQDKFKGKPQFPRPLGNCIGGGKHTKELKKPDFQEFLILPRVKSKKEGDMHHISLQAYKELKNTLKSQDKLFSGKMTDENAFISSFDNERIIKLMKGVQAKIRTKFNEDLELGIDAAASSFFNKEKKIYNYVRLDGKPGTLTPKEQINYVFELCKKYNLAYFEDPLDENDFSGYSKLLKKIKDAGLKTLIVGDDLICTNSNRLKKAIKSKSINAVIVKPNQCGSLLETKKVVDIAKKNNIVPVFSHRSGETSDPILAELALGWQVPIIKISVVGVDNFKTNDLIRIERKLE